VLTPYSLHTLDPTHSRPYTLHPTLYILDPTPGTLNPQPLNPYTPKP